MQDRIIRNYGWVKNTSYTHPGTTVTSSSPVNYLSEAFTVYVDNLNGDFRTPNGNSWRKEKFFAGIGLLRNYNVFSSDYFLSVGTGVESPNTYAIPDLDVESRCLQLLDERASSKIRGSLDLAVSVIQHGQVTNMLRNANSLVKYVRKFSPKRWASTWLEYQYGWRPLINDIYGSVSKLMEPDRPLVRLLIRAHVDDTASKTVSSSGQVPATITQFAQARGEYLIKFKQNANLAHTLSGWTTLNPASIAWELVPYSFIADWFIDIGGYLRNLETAALAAQFDFDVGYRTVSTRHTFTGMKSGTVHLGGGSYSTQSGSAYRRVTVKTRSPMSGYPQPRLPSINVSLGSERIFSAAALLREHFTRRS